MTVVELAVGVCCSAGAVVPQPLFDDPNALYAVCGRCSPKGLSLNMIDDRSEMSSAVDPPLDATRGSASTDLAFKSSRAAIRLDLARSLAQCIMLTPENSEIRQQEKTMAAMLPLRFHSAISALVVLVAEEVVVVVEELDVVVVELLEVVDAEVVVDCEEVDDVELEVVVEVDDVVVDVDVDDEVVVDVVDVSEEVFVVEGSEVVLSAVVDDVDSEVVDVSRATMMIRLIPSRISKTFGVPSRVDDGSSCLTVAVAFSSEEAVGAPYGWHAAKAKCDARSRTAAF